MEEDLKNWVEGVTEGDAWGLLSPERLLAHISKHKQLIKSHLIHDPLTLRERAQTNNSAL